jgi:DNA-binding ferritin-like protein (Dps family)
LSKDETGKTVELPLIEPETKEGQAYNQMRKADLFIENAELSFGSAFNQAWKYGTQEQKNRLRTLSENYREDLSKINGQMWAPLKRKEILDHALKDLEIITKEQAPEIYQNVTDFAVEKASETFGNLAARSYEELNQDKAPTLAIEHVLFGMGLSKADQLKEVIEKSRDNFVDFLMQKKGFSESDARNLASKKIGATWDTGHINIMKKYGFDDKDIIEETKKITPLVKHVHITDNFGYADTHLAPGMGNVPIKEILEQLEKNGRYDEMRKIVEAGGFVQHFKKSPFPLSLAAFGSPIYGMKSGMGWNQTQGVEGSYFGGYGTVSPQTHHSYFGAGFTTMPVELGGQMPGGNSRFGGTPMA